MRHPRDYAPLINLRSISETEDDRGGSDELETLRADLFRKIENALDDLLIDGQRRSTGIQKSAAFVGLSKGDTTDERRRGEEQPVEGLEKLWNDASRSAVAVNAGILLPRILMNMAVLLDVLRAPAVQAAAMRQLDTTVRTLTREHVLAPLRGIVMQCREEARRRRDAEPHHSARRAPLRTRADLFEKILGSMPVDEYLDRFIAGDKDIPHEKLEQLLDDDEVIALLFGACVAVAAEEWKTARSFIERARLRASQWTEDPRQIRPELNYCLALILRFNMRHIGDYLEALRILEAGAKRDRQNDDTFGELRAESEAAAVTGVFLFKLKLLRGFASLPPSEERDFLRAAHDHIERAQELIRERAGSPPEQPARQDDDERLGLQTYANSVCLGLYDLWIMRIPEADILPYLDEQRRELERRIERWLSQPDWNGGARHVPNSVMALDKVAAAVVAPGHAAPAKIDDACIFLRGMLSRSNLVDFDKIEYQFFLEKLEVVRAAA